MSGYIRSQISKVFNIYEVRHYVCELLNPHDLANLFRALETKPRNLEYKKYLNVINYVFKLSKLSEIIDNNKCKLILLGKDIQHIKNHININSVFCANDIYNEGYIVYCIVLCLTDHKHHRLQNIIQKECNIMVRIVEFNIPSCIYDDNMDLPNFQMIPVDDDNVIVCFSLDYISCITTLSKHEILHELLCMLPNLHSTTYITNSDDYWSIEMCNEEFMIIEQTGNSRIDEYNKISSLILFSKYEELGIVHLFKGFKFNF